MADLYRSALICAKGCVRSNNEDNFYFLGDRLRLSEMDGGAHIACTGGKERQAYAIFDGMGGEESGEEAACAAAEAFAGAEESLYGGDIKKALDTFARSCTAQIAKNAEEHRYNGHGSTFAALIITGERAVVANVGDSRVYLMRGRELNHVTRDHSFVYNLYLDGKLTLEQARKHPRSNVISHYLGQGPDRVGEDFVFTDSFKLYADDRFMLCSDGVCDLLSDARIKTLLLENPTADAAATALVAEALELGGKDNTTCIVVDVLDKRLPKRE